MSTAEDLQHATQHFFTDHARDFGLRADAVAVTYVLNPGGFVNFSFRISDGRTHLHAKLSTADGGQRRLSTWHELDPLLRRHRAPPVLARVKLGSATGLVFPSLPGRSPTFGEGVFRSVLTCVKGLWADDDLADRLRTNDPRPTVTAADAYLETYHDRFSADLAEIASRRPPFVDGATLALMQGEADALAQQVRTSAVFQAPMTTPTHGDLWLNNVLWESAKSWWLLDWDDIEIGDPALDLAMLTGPTPDDLRPLKLFDLVKQVAPPEVVDRLALLGRASLLDWVIDPLADWIEAEVAPEHLSRVRAEKEHLHTDALALYGTLYGA